MSVGPPINIPPSIPVDLSATYCNIRFRVYVTVADVTIPAEEVRVEYPINDIPVCQVKAIVGMDMSDFVFSIAQQLREELFQLPITITLNILSISGRFNPNNYFIGPRTIFEGYVTRIEYMRDVTSISVTIQGVHWLYNLAFSSALSDRLHPQTPRDITFNPFMVSGGGALGALLSVDFFAKLLPPPLVFKDVGAAIIFLLRYIANIDRFLLQYFPRALWYNDTFNRYAGWALSRIVYGDPRLPLYDEFSYVDSFLGFAIYSILISGSVEHGPLTLENLAETTIWERLTKVLSPLFLFAIVPYPTYARIVPYMPTYHDPWRVIQPTEIFSIHFSSALSRPLLGTVILTQMNTPKDDDMGLNLDSLQATNVGGIYLGYPDGMLDFKYAPPYANFMVSVPAMAAMQGLASYIIGAKRRGFNFAFPGNRLPSTLNWRKQDYIQAGVLNRLAHFYYTLELLKDRRAIVVCPIRFDISPGSIVVISSLNEKFVSYTGIGTMMTGYVNSVSHIFRSEEHNPMAATIFELSFVRFGMQNFLPNFTIPFHPLYNAFFKGSTFFGDMYIPMEIYAY
ncbi:MAG: hypothetical protein QXQ37_04905 [Nitrososphaerota archaeon]